MRILVWGREGNYGPDYPRNRVVFEAMRALGHEVAFFRPRLSTVADVEARLRALPVPDVVWVPCFRQRDMAAGGGGGGGGAWTHVAGRTETHHRQPGTRWSARQCLSL
jgi:hypothetical protein